MDRKFLVAALAAAALGGCGDQPRGDVTTPPPLAHAPAPDTSTMGAGPGRQRLAANCGLNAQEALRRINAARASGRRCGGRAMPPAPPLRWDPQLQAAAAGHSADMARRNYFEHSSPEGVQVSQRVSASRYKWRSVGENLAGGNRTIAEAVEGWLGSPPHCENLMDPRYLDVAVACVAQPGTDWGTYWTMVLGRR